MFACFQSELIWSTTQTDHFRDCIHQCNFSTVLLKRTVPTCSNQIHSVTLSPSMLPSSPTSVCECSSQKLITRTVSLSPFFALKCAVLFDVMFCSYPLHCSGKILLITKEVPFYFVCPFSTMSSYGQGKKFHTYCLDNYLTLQRVERNTQTAQLPCLPCRLSSCIQKAFLHQCPALPICNT